MDFDLEDIKPALRVQVVAGMYFDRRVFFVGSTPGKSGQVVIALTPHQARSIAADLDSQYGTGEVHDRSRPVQRAVVVRPFPSFDPTHPPEVPYGPAEESRTELS